MAPDAERGPPSARSGSVRARSDEAKEGCGGQGFHSERHRRPPRRSGAADPVATGTAAVEQEASGRRRSAARPALTDTAGSNKRRQEGSSTPRSSSGSSASSTTERPRRMDESNEFISYIKLMAGAVGNANPPEDGGPSNFFMQGGSSEAPQDDCPSNFLMHGGLSQAPQDVMDGTLSNPIRLHEPRRSSPHESVHHPSHDPSAASALGEH